MAEVISIETINQLAKQVASSAIVVGQIYKGAEACPLMAMQVGLAIAHDKPLLIIALEGASVSEALEKVASEVIRVPVGQVITAAELHPALDRLHAKAKEQRQRRAELN